MISVLPRHDDRNNIHPPAYHTCLKPHWHLFWSPSSLTSNLSLTMTSKENTKIQHYPSIWLYDYFAKDCLFASQEKDCTTITWLFVCLFVCRSSHCRVAQYTGKWFLTAPPSDHIQSETLFQTSQDHTRGVNGPASRLHSSTGSCLYLCLFVRSSSFTGER